MIKAKKLKYCIDCGERLGKKTKSRCKKCFDHAYHMWGGNCYKTRVYIPMSDFCGVCQNKKGYYGVYSICLKHLKEIQNGK